MIILPKQSTDSVLPLSNNQWHFLTELEQQQQKILKICMETQKTLNSKSNLENDTSTLDECKY